MIFPQLLIDETKKQTERDLTRFDLDFDLPEHFLPEFPPAVFLTTRPDLGDVSQGKLVTNRNFYELFSGILTPKQLNGVRLLTSTFAQQQFNLTDDRRSIIQRHLDTCQPCAEPYDFEAELRIVISKKCREEVPQDLKARIRAQLQGEG